MGDEKETLEERADKYYEFQPGDFIPLIGSLRYNRRTLRGYGDEREEAGKKYLLSRSAQINSRRTLLMIYSLLFVMGAAKFIETVYGKL